MVNYQSYAVELEHLGHFPYLSANEIRRDPIGFLDVHCLDALEKKRLEEVCSFWDKYSIYKGRSMDELGEETVRALVSDFIALVR